MMTYPAARDVTARLLAAGELDPAPTGRQMADGLIRVARERLAKLPEYRTLNAWLACETLYLAVTNAMSATIEVQGLRPGTFGGDRGSAEVAAAQAMYEVVSAQLGGQHGPEVETLGRLIRQQEAVEYQAAPVPEVTDQDIRDATAVVDLAERIVNETEAGQ